jgi:hypothetical protein
MLLFLGWTHRWREKEKVTELEGGLEGGLEEGSEEESEDRVDRTYHSPDSTYRIVWIYRTGN